MVFFQHEKPNFNVNPSRSKPRASFGLCSENPGGLYRNKSGGPIADIGGSASGMDRRSFGSDASELKHFNAQSKRKGIRVFGGHAKARTSSSSNGRNCSGSRAAFGEISFRIWD